MAVTAALVFFSATGQVCAGLVGLWTLDEGTDQIIRDSSGNGLHGYLGTSAADTLQDPIWAANGSTIGSGGGTSLSFPYPNNGNFYRARVNDAPLLTPASGQLTLTADINPDDATLQKGIFIAKHSTGTSGSYLLDFSAFNTTTGDGTIQFAVINTASTRVNLSWTMPASEKLNGWHQVTGTYDGSAMRLYFDGILRGSVAQSGAIKVSSQTFQIGQFDGNTAGWQYEGQLDNTAIFDNALGDGGVAVGEAALPGSAIYQLYHEGAISFVPEPTSVSLCLLAASGWIWSRRKYPRSAQHAGGK